MDKTENCHGKQNKLLHKHLSLILLIKHINFILQSIKNVNMQLHRAEQYVYITMIVHMA